ncbi:MAG: low molecular weight phosphatase family protein [Candidatus Peregrinibacteria bacterium]
MKKVLFICMSNSRRSQMAEAIYKSLGGSAKSAGIDPAGGDYQIDPNVISALKEMKIETKGLKTKQLTEEMLDEADKIITFRCADLVPKKYHAKIEDWDLGAKRQVGQKQAERTLDEIRMYCDLIYQKVKRFKEQLEIS